VIVAADVQMRRPAPVIPAPPVVAPAPVSSRGVYAIQLASYAGNQSAQSEVQRLQRKGVQALVVKQNKYFELRAVGFQSRVDAEKALLTLKKVYRDAFIKQPSVS
jgi:cell division septation protein DedD